MSDYYMWHPWRPWPPCWRTSASRTCRPAGAGSLLRKHVAQVNQTTDSNGWRQGFEASFRVEAVPSTGPLCRLCSRNEGGCLYAIRERVVHWLMRKDRRDLGGVHDNEGTIEKSYA